MLDIGLYQRSLSVERTELKVHGRYLTETWLQTLS
jgi:hypothetical protein